MNEQTVAIGALGRVINLSDRRIQQLVKEGVLERHEKGRYPFLSNVKAYGSTFRHEPMVAEL